MSAEIPPAKLAAQKYERIKNHGKAQDAGYFQIGLGCWEIVVLRPLEQQFLDHRRLDGGSAAQKRVLCLVAYAESVPEIQLEAHSARQSKQRWRTGLYLFRPDS